MCDRNNALKMVLLMAGLIIIFNYEAWAECLGFILLLFGFLVQSGCQCGPGTDRQAGKLQMWTRGRVFGKSQAGGSTIVNPSQLADCFKAMLTMTVPFIF